MTIAEALKNTTREVELPAPRPREARAVPALRKTLLACGVLASVLYVAIDFVAALRYPAYHSFTSQAISELMASGAPTERLVDPPFLAYDVLMMAFAVGLWLSDSRARVRVLGGLLFAYAAIGLSGPTLFEMNVRGSNADPAADVLHIAATSVLSLFIFAAFGVGAAVHGKLFRLYSIASIAASVLLGVLTSFASTGLAAGAPTPWLGVSERALIGVFLVWVAVLAASFWRAQGLRRPVPPAQGLRAASAGRASAS